MSLLLASALPGCGFSPVYATSSGGLTGPAEEGLAETTIGLMPERTGQLLRQALQAQFEHGGAGLARRYDLTVSIGLTGDPIAVLQDSSITRIRLVATAAWTLTGQDPQRSTLASGTARVDDGFNIVNEQFFFTDLQNEAIQRRMMEALADQITLRVAGYFKRRAAAAT